MKKILSYQSAFDVLLILLVGHLSAFAQEMSVLISPTDQYAYAVHVLKCIDKGELEITDLTIRYDSARYTVKAYNPLLGSVDLNNRIRLVVAESYDHYENSSYLIAADDKSHRYYRLLGFKGTDLLSLIDDVRDLYPVNVKHSRDEAITILEEAFISYKFYSQGSIDFSVKEMYQEIIAAGKK